MQQVHVPTGLTEWWHGPNYDLDHAAELTGFARHQIRDLGKTVFKFRFWHNRRGAVNLLALEEVFLLQIFKELDGVISGRKAGALLMPAIVDYARRVLAAPDVELRRDVQFYGWPNAEGGWTWVEAVDGKSPDKAPEVRGSVYVVVSGSRLLHDFLRKVLADVETDALQPIRVAAMREAA